MANLQPSPQIDSAKQDEDKQILLNRKLVAKWYALCRRQDISSTEVVVERVDIGIREQHRLLCAMDARVLRQQTEYEDIGQEHDMPIPLWYTKRRGSACSSQSAGSAASLGSLSSVNIGNGGFKPWPKSEDAEEESDVWRFGKSATEQSSLSESAYDQKEKRQPSTGTCIPQ